MHPPKFLQSPLLYVPYMPQGCPYMPQGCPYMPPLPSGCCHPQRHNFQTFLLRPIKWLSKFLLDRFEEMPGVGGGLATLQSLWAIKKGTSPFNFLSNELFLKFLRQQIAISKFLSGAFRENMRYGGQKPSDHSGY